MSGERGARLGWTVGGIGSLFWIPGMGMALFSQDDILGAIGALACFALGLAYLRGAAPWRHPTVRLRSLYAGFLAIQFVSAAFIILRYLPFSPELRAEGSAWLFFCLLPLLLPLVTLGARTWPAQAETDAETSEHETDPH